MKRIGLALSGGGFRATLYHLGVARFLRDAGILSQVTHITAVSGGSILAAHLVLNWDRFNGSDKDFDDAANELIRFIRLDVRNRIIRRYPFAVIRSFARWATRRGSDRMLTRSGMLEAYYEQYLYGERCLYELPKSPELHLLATDITEGCLCSFTRNGLIMQRRLPGDKLEFERIAAGLASVPLAVAASSAFAGFFPPISIQANDIGASELVFTRQAFTDGGVYDNLGVRAFRFIERCWGEDGTLGEVADREVQIEQLSGTDTGRLPSGAGTATAATAARAAASRGQRAAAATATLKQRPDDHQRDSSRDLNRESFDTRADDSDGQSSEDEEARRFREEFGKTAHLPSAPPTSGNFDAVITSDAGGKLMVERRLHGSGIIRTAMRSSDILMDRVWQLEKEIVGAAPGFFFAPIAQVVEPDDDPHAPPTVIQHQVSNIRTDFDRFSDTEIRALAMHGYCVVRHTCRQRPDLFGNVPDGPPWDPVPPREPLIKVPKIKLPGLKNHDENQPARIARELQQSADRRIWSTLLDPHDLWTYAFAALVFAIFAIVPYLAWKVYTGTASQHSVLTTLAESDADYRQLIDLLAGGTPSSLPALEPQVVAELRPPDYSRFDIVSDFHIVDMRAWGPSLVPMPTLIASRRTYEFRRLKVRRRQDVESDGHLRFQFVSTSGDFQIASDSAEFSPVLRRVAPPSDQPHEIRWELDFDLSQQPAGQSADVSFRQLYRPELNGRADNGGPSHESYDDTQLATMWILQPTGHRHRRLELVRIDPDHTNSYQVVTPDRRLRARRGAVEGWQLLDAIPGRYECRWAWE